MADMKPRGLLERDVRRKRNDIRIGLDLKDHRSIA
jgi:hypothetical protein